MLLTKTLEESIFCWPIFGVVVFFVASFCCCCCSFFLCAVSSHLHSLCRLILLALHAICCYCWCRLFVHCFVAACSFSCAIRIDCGSRLKANLSLFSNVLPSHRIQCDLRLCGYSEIIVHCCMHIHTPALCQINLQRKRAQRCLLFFASITGKCNEMQKNL